MKILSRRVVVTKSYEEVSHILKSSAYFFPEIMISGTIFSMYCAKRYNGGHLSLTPVKGTIVRHNNQSKVIIEVHADFSFFLGILITVIGIVGLVWLLISQSSRLIPQIGLILIGILVCGHSWCEGVELLDRLEHKLLR